MYPSTSYNNKKDSVNADIRRNAVELSFQIIHNWIAFDLDQDFLFDGISNACHICYHVRYMSGNMYDLDL